jgi:hypothetical protein
VEEPNQLEQLVHSVDVTQIGLVRQFCVS